MKHYILSLVLILGVCPAFSQRAFEYNASLSGEIATGRLPFWQSVNRYGLVPESNGAALNAGIFSDFNSKHKIRLAYGVSAAGYLSKYENKIFIDQLYTSFQWTKLRLDLGMIHPDTEYNGLSSTNGNIVNSANARTLPGYNLRTEYIFVPLCKEVLSFKFNWGDYTMIDDRFVDRPRLHNKSLFVRIKPHRHLEIILGIEHWAQWAGKSPLYGKQPSSFRDYVRIVCAKEGGQGATVSDSVNALGNHLGREHIRINYLADDYTLTFYHDIPFEDASGTDFRSFPDGTYCFYYGSKHRQSWITDVMYEFYYTKYQSGSLHDRPLTPEEIEQTGLSSSDRKILGGRDNYFNNGEYRSGWTAYGRTIGSPFIIPYQRNQEGFVPGVYNNRIIAHYLGIQGQAFRQIPYKLRLSYTLNYGTYSNPLPEIPRQFSFGLETRLLSNKNLPLDINCGIFGDFGQLFPHTVGLSISFTYKEILIKSHTNQ